MCKVYNNVRGQPFVARSIEFGVESALEFVWRIRPKGKTPSTGERPPPANGVLFIQKHLN